MSESPKSVEDLAIMVADGSAVDWDEAIRSASTDAELRVVRRLQLMQAVARIHGGEASESPALVSAAAPPPSSPTVVESATSASGRGTWGHLVLHQKLSEGSYGELYRAWDPRLDRAVALKLYKAPPSTPDSSLASGVIEEGRLLAKLRHPNVVTVYGADIHDGRMGLWMELIPGRSLEQIHAEQGLMGAREAAAIGVDLCSALAAVHATGIVHRDVKAQNVMREQGGRILLMDFGAGIEVRPDQDLPGVRITGTPYYMAPELLRGEAATRQSDIYGLGVLLFRLVSGRFPLEAASWGDLIERHQRGERALLRDVRPNLPEGFVAVVERAIAPDPSQRFATAGQMEQALAQVSGGVVSAAPVMAPAPGSGRGPLAVIVMVAAAVTLGTALWWYSMRSADRLAPATSSPSASGDAALSVPPSPATPVAYTVAAALYRAPQSGPRERLEPGARLALGDQLTLEIEASTPLHVYVVNEDEAGHAYALFPLPELEPQNPLKPGIAHVLPGRRDGKSLSWTVDSPGGREHLLVLASPTRLVEYETEMSALARPGEAAITLSEAAGLRLRGLGRLSKTPSAGDPRTAGRLFEMAQSLASRSETVSGVWMRQIDLENPRP